MNMKVWLTLSPTVIHEDVHQVRQASCDTLQLPLLSLMWAISRSEKDLSGGRLSPSFVIHSALPEIVFHSTADKMQASTTALKLHANSQILKQTLISGSPSLKIHDILLLFSFFFIYRWLQIMCVWSFRSIDLPHEKGKQKPEITRHGRNLGRLKNDLFWLQLFHALLSEVNIHCHS